MRHAAVLCLAALGLVVAAQGQDKPGKWLDTTKDTLSDKYSFVVGGGGKLLLTEDYEVVKTHEICASLYGVFMEQSQLGRYNVNFKGMRTSATFTFTTQYDAEHWVEKWCTPESLLSIRGGRGDMARKY
jgi:hypothetical protein